MPSIEQRSSAAELLPIAAWEVSCLQAAGDAAWAYSQHFHERTLVREPVDHREALRVALTIGLVMLHGGHGEIDDGSLDEAVNVAAAAWDGGPPRDAMLRALRSYERVP